MHKKVIATVSERDFSEEIIVLQKVLLDPYIALAKNIPAVNKLVQKYISLLNNFNTDELKKLINESPLTKQLFDKQLQAYKQEKAKKKKEKEKNALKILAINQMLSKPLFFQIESKPIKDLALQLRTIVEQWSNTGLINQQNFFTLFQNSFIGKQLELNYHKLKNQYLLKD